MRTGTLTFILRHLVMLSLACQMSHAQGMSHSEKLDQVRALVSRATNEPYSMESLIPDPVKRAEWVQQQLQKHRAAVEAIKTTPGLNPYLFELLKDNYQTHPNEGMTSVLKAIALRDDLTTAEVESIAAESKKILSRPYDGTAIGSEYLMGAVSVLGKYPSAEHEKILIAVLGRGEVEYPLYVRAAINLEKMGGPESLAALDQAILKTAHFKNTKGESFYSILVNSKQVIQDRLKSARKL